MKKTKKYFYLIVLLIIIFGLSFPHNLKAESTETNVCRHIWKEDSLINGFDSLENSFYVSKNMDISEFVLNLKIKPSPTLIEDLSSISIILNNKPVYSIKLEDVDKNGLLNIKIPEHLIFRGHNSIIIDGFLKSTMDRCELNSDINWIIIEKGSFFSFKFNKKDSQYIRDIFETTYYPDGEKGSVQIVIPDDLTEDNYTQISSLSALLGYIHKDKELDLKIKTIPYSEVNNINKESILIGSPQQIKSFNKDLFTEKEWNDAKNNGFIGLRKIGDKNHFILIISDNSQLETLTGILQNESSLLQIKDKNYILDKDKRVNNINFNTHSSFKNLGYDSLSKSGSGVKSFNYYLTIPANKVLTSNNKFVFNYNYSSLLKSDDAHVNLAINDKNLISKQLLKESDKGQLEFSIPEEFFHETGFSISLKFNLEPEVESCTETNYDFIWVEVDTKNSFFDLDLNNREEYSLISSQGLFQDSNGYIQGDIMVDNLKNLSIDALCNFSSYLGRVSQGVNKLSLNQVEGNNNFIGAIIGLNSSSLVQNESHNLQIPILENGNFVDQNLFVQNTDTLGLIALSLDNNKLLIIGNDEKQLNLAIENFPNTISPNTNFILKDGELIDYFNQLEDIGDIEEKTKTIEMDIIIALSVFIAFIVIVFALYYIKVR